MEDLRILYISRRRNGVSGEPFYFIRFTDKVFGILDAVCFGEKTMPDGCLVAVTNPLFPQEAFRGDVYQELLWEKIHQYEKNPEEMEKTFIFN